MTQDERWNIRYQEVVSFVRTPGQACFVVCEHEFHELNE